MVWFSDGCVEDTCPATFTPQQPAASHQWANAKHWSNAAMYGGGKEDESGTPGADFRCFLTFVPRGIGTYKRVSEPWTHVPAPQSASFRLLPTKTKSCKPECVCVRVRARECV